MTLKRMLQTNPAFPFAYLPVRAFRSFRDTIGPQLARWAAWLVTSREDTNFTYDLSPVGMKNLTHGIATVLNKPFGEIDAYVSELLNDDDLRQHIQNQSIASVRRYRTDPVARYGKRLGWYAVVRALKPKLIVEAGVDKGLGSVVLCAAILKNSEDGFAGRYIGTDINPDAGYFLQGKYAEVGGIAFGDSIQSLRSIDAVIDLFINDSDHDENYEAKEYDVIADKMSRDGVIIGDNSHATTKLAEFCERAGWRFVMLNEQPACHWYPGGGVGLALRPRGYRDAHP